LPNDNSSFRNPIAALALLLVVAVIALIASAVFGIDRGVLTNMADREYARGLITFLFAVVTIGTALVLVVSALLGSSDHLQEKRFQQGKEVLSLLLGVFGTILGFYFGSTFQTTRNTPLRVSPLQVVPDTVAPGSLVLVRALVVGGAVPYRYSISFGAGPPAINANVSDNGDISEKLPVPKSTPQTLLQIRLSVVDAHGEQATVAGSVHIR
jgi:hypothetical protein